MEQERIDEPVCERCFSATEWRTCPECGCEHMCDVCGYCPTCADEQAAPAHNLTR